VEGIRHLGHLLSTFEKESGFDADIDPEWAVSEAATDHTVQRITDSECVALVAVCTDEIVGFLMGSIRDAKGVAAGALESMLVLPQYRKRKIGTRLIERFLDWTRRRGLKRVTVAVAPANGPAIALYKQMGFQEQTLIWGRRD
jgi:GNAT superfamily N-acetyltransferase